MKWVGLILMFLAEAAPCYAREQGTTPMRLEMVIRKDSDLGQRVFQAFERVLRRHGFVLSVEEFPSQRGIQEMRRGRVDGTVGRVGDLAKIHGLKDFIRLNAPLMVYTVSMWCSKTAPDMLTLKNPRVAYFPGNIFAMRTVQLIQDRSIVISEIQSFASLIKMLEKDRLDCLVASDTILDKDRIQVESLKNFHRHTLIAAPAYPWILRKYESSVKALQEDLLAEQDELYVNRWQKDWKPGCALDFNRICPDGRLFTQAQAMPDQDWRMEMPWADN